MQTIDGELIADIPSLVGELTTEGILSGELVADIPTMEAALVSDTPTLEGELVSDIPALEGELVTINDSLALTSDLIITSITDDNVPIYDGTYEITPLVGTEQLLDTSGKKLESDVIVFPIPYYETTNESGGYTVIIG